MNEMIDGEELASDGSVFGKLLKKRVRVIFQEDSDSESTCWIGELVKDNGDFIELRSEDGRPSFINKRHIVAVSLMKRS